MYNRQIVDTDEGFRRAIKDGAPDGDVAEADVGTDGWG